MTGETLHLPADSAAQDRLIDRIWPLTASNLSHTNIIVPAGGKLTTVVDSHTEELKAELSQKAAAAEVMPHLKVEIATEDVDLATIDLTSEKQKQMRDYQKAAYAFAKMAGQDLEPTAENKDRVITIEGNIGNAVLGASMAKVLYDYVDLISDPDAINAHNQYGNEVAAENNYDEKTTGDILLKKVELTGSMLNLMFNVWKMYGLGRGETVEFSNKIWERLFTLKYRNLVPKRYSTERQAGNIYSLIPSMQELMLNGVHSEFTGTVATVEALAKLNDKFVESYFPRAAAAKVDISRGTDVVIYEPTEENPKHIGAVLQVKEIKSAQSEIIVNIPTDEGLLLYFDSSQELARGDMARFVDNVRYSNNTLSLDRLRDYANDRQAPWIWTLVKSVK